MTLTKPIVAIYDFEVFPFALGDVLTWNIRTAMRCEELGRNTVDIYICADEKYPAWVHQREMINAQNFDLFFTELYSAFGTHPCLGNIHIFRQRHELVERLRKTIQ
jgi:ligand-binding SRPBCC domain-containing protein